MREQTMTPRESALGVGKGGMMSEQQNTYVVIENTPGYMPDDCDPFVTNDYAEAVSVMREDINRYVDEITEAGGEPEVEEGWASSTNLAAAKVYDHSRMHDLGRYFAVELAESDA